MKKEEVRQLYNGEKYAVVQCRFKDEDCAFNTIVKLDVEEDENDADIFFYFNGVEDLMSAVGNESQEDFIINKVIEFTDVF